MTDPMEFHALADGELDAAQAARLNAAPGTAAEVGAILGLKAMLADRSLRHTDDEAWQACVRRLDAIDKSRRVEGFLGRYGWALCGLMFAFIVSGRFAMRSLDGSSASAQEVAGFVGRAHRPLSVEERVRQQAQRDLLAAVGSSLNPNEIQVGTSASGWFRDLPATRFPLRDRTGDLVLVRVNGPLNLQDTSPVGPDSYLSAGVAEGNNLVAWQSNGQTYLLYGDRPLSDLGAFASHVLGAR